MMYFVLESFDLGLVGCEVVVRREFVIECRDDFGKTKSAGDSTDKSADETKKE